MNTSRSIPIRAVVEARERPIVEAAAELLALALQEATGEAWSCHCDYAANIDQLSTAVADAVVLTTLSSALERLDTPWPQIEAELRDGYARLSESGAPVMICTILRHVDAATTPNASQLRRRLRQLNLLVTELSREYGSFVIDIDRVLADIGARRLHTDYRLEGPAALGATSGAIASSLVANALDAFASVDVQDKARDILDRNRLVVGLAPEIKMTNVMALGRGRKKQLVSTVTDSVQENHVVWQLRQVFAGQIGPREAADKLFQAVRRRGTRESAALLFSGIARLFKS